MIIFYRNETDLLIYAALSMATSAIAFFALAIFPKIFKNVCNNVQDEATNNRQD